MRSRISIVVRRILVTVLEAALVPATIIVLVLVPLLALGLATRKKNCIVQYTNNNSTASVIGKTRAIVMAASDSNHNSNQMAVGKKKR